MRKFAILALAALLLFAFTMPAPAMEYNFGGYWRTRWYTNQNFTGYDKEDVTDADLKAAGVKKDITRVDTRTRLYFTAVFNENLKFVNKFEMDAFWGDSSTGTKGKSYGGIGADGTTFEIKNSYADFKVGAVNAKVGVQGVRLARGFMFDDDAGAVSVAFNAGNVSIPVVWVKAFDDDSLNKRDVDYFIVSPTISAGNVKINPFGLYAYSEDAKGWSKTADFGDVDMYYVGGNLDVDFGAGSFWLTGIYQGGEAELAGSEDTVDFKAYLGAAGAKVNIGIGDFHLQGFYASGDDSPNDNDMEKFFVPQGQSYYWSEIMGYGTFDNQLPNGAPGDKIGNIMAGNVGVTLKPAPKLSVSLDAWYAALAEDIVVGIDNNGNNIEENALGIEANVKVTYQIVEGLNLDLVGAYLFAGDALYQGTGEADPYEFGTRLSLSF
ncbi:MAG: hypothetical protein B6245_00695 [Desulfobacteraceae bacterium 4572_88]|nr:MAG: hypothetical protein B6245_00695 [Desulfobacteraceae bacterium 4572_88]